MNRRSKVLSSFWDERKKYAPRLVIPVNLATNKKVQGLYPFNDNNQVSSLIELVNDEVEISANEAAIEVRLVVYDRLIPSPMDQLKHHISQTEEQKMIDNYLAESEFNPEFGIVKGHRYIVEIWDREVREKDAKYCPYGIDPCNSSPNDQICEGCLHYHPKKDGESSGSNKYITTNWCTLFPDE